MLRNIIFDWSGTLVDDLPAVWKATNYVFRQAGLDELSLDRFRAEFCLPFTKFYARYTPHIPQDQLERWFHGHFRICQDDVIELPHARSFLQACRQRGVRTFLLSTIHREHFARQAEATGFHQYLDRPYLEVIDKKARIHDILAENDLSPRETLFIGDMEHDIETARHGGIYSCAVLTGYNRLEQLRAAQPDLIVEHLGELGELLERHQWHFQPARGFGQAAPDAIPVTTVGALVFDSAGRVLMIRTQKWSGLWGIPGGKIKFGETAIEALRRELKEETDLEVRDIEFVVVQDCIHSKEFYRDAHFVLLNYTCRAQGESTVRLNEEAQEFRWVTLAEALAMPLNQPTRTLLEIVGKGK
jgi:phosphoglycolate phosphatase